MDKLPSAKDVLDAIETSDVDDAIDRVLAMTPDEVQKELEVAGYAPGEIDDKADALFERMKRAPVEQAMRRLEDEARGRSVRPASRPRPLVLLLAASLVIAGGGLLYAALRSPTPAPGPPAPSAPVPSAPSAAPVPSADLIAAAASLRRQATGACGERRWADCARALDEAESKDPAGEKAAEVTALRKKIAEETDKKRVLP